MPVVSKEELFGLVGKDVGTSEWMLIDQDRVNKFAEATGDFQFIHVDPERAKMTLVVRSPMASCRCRCSPC